MKLYRCTRNLPYESHSSPGHLNPSERRAVYITASSREMALLMMARRFPHDCIRVSPIEAFTADFVPNQRYLNHHRLNDYLFAGG